MVVDDARRAQLIMQAMALLGIQCTDQEWDALVSALFEALGVRRPERKQEAE